MPNNYISDCAGISNFVEERKKRRLELRDRDYRPIAKRERAYDSTEIASGYLASAPLGSCDEEPGVSYFWTNQVSVAKFSTLRPRRMR